MEVAAHGEACDRQQRAAVVREREGLRGRREADTRGSEDQARNGRERNARAGDRRARKRDRLRTKLVGDQQRPARGARGCGREDDADTAGGMRCQRVAEQVLVAANGPLETTAFTSSSATSPALVSISCCAALLVPTCVVANVSEALAESASVAGALPVPVSDAVCVPASSTKVSVPVRVPLASQA